MDSMSVNPIQKFYTSDFVMDSKFNLEIENFAQYPAGQVINCAKVDFFECDANWRIKCLPFHLPNGNAYFDLELHLSAEDMWKSKKYQYRLTVSSGISTANKLYTGAYKAIEIKDIVYQGNCCPRSTLMNSLAETGSLSLIFKVEIRYLGDPICRQKRYCTTNAKLERMDQYVNLLNDSTFCDFTFIVKGKSFNVHKSILASASETMRAMFTTNLNEFVQGECRIDHIEPTVFQHMLQFIYAGIISAEIDNIAVDLYKAAHYYRIEKLTEICGENIRFNLNASNALDIYELSTLYDMEDVKTDAWKIIKCQLLKVFFPLKSEPLPLEDIQEIIAIKKEMIAIKDKETAYWLKHKRTN